jgi:hypothetical protein
VSIRKTANLHLLPLLDPAAGADGGPGGQHRRRLKRPRPRLVCARGRGGVDNHVRVLTRVGGQRRRAGDGGLRRLAAVERGGGAPVAGSRREGVLRLWLFVARLRVALVRPGDRRRWQNSGGGACGPQALPLYRAWEAPRVCGTHAEGWRRLGQAGLGCRARSAGPEAGPERADADRVGP